MAKKDVTFDCSLHVAGFSRLHCRELNPYRVEVDHAEYVEIGHAT
jgi:hypothetical protein